jgi:hypothetical protein
MSEKTNDEIWDDCNEGGGGSSWPAPGEHVARIISYRPFLFKTGTQAVEFTLSVGAKTAKLAINCHPKSGFVMAGFVKAAGGTKDQFRPWNPTAVYSPGSTQFLNSLMGRFLMIEVEKLPPNEDGKVYSEISRYWKAPEGTPGVAGVTTGGVGAAYVPPSPTYRSAPLAHGQPHNWHRPARDTENAPEAQAPIGPPADDLPF